MRRFNDYKTIEKQFKGLRAWDTQTFETSKTGFREKLELLLLTCSKNFHPDFGYPDKISAYREAPAKFGRFATDGPFEHFVTSSKHTCFSTKSYEGKYACVKAAYAPYIALAHRCVIHYRKKVTHSSPFGANKSIDLSSRRNPNKIHGEGKNQIFIENVL